MKGYSEGSQKRLKHNIELGDEYSLTFVIVPDQNGQSEFKEMRSLGEQVLISNQTLINEKEKMMVEEYDDFEVKQSILDQKDQTQCSSVIFSEAQDNKDYDQDFSPFEKEPQIDFQSISKINIKHRKRQAYKQKVQKNNVLMSYISFNNRKYYLDPNPYYDYTLKILEQELQFHRPTIQNKIQFEQWLYFRSLENLREYYWYLDRLRLQYYNGVYENQYHREYYLNELQKNYPKWQMLYISWWTQKIRLQQAFNYHPCYLDTHNFKIKEILNMIPLMIWNIKNHYKQKNRQKLSYWQNDNQKVIVYFTIMTGWGKNSLHNKSGSRTQTINWCQRNQYLYHALKDQVDIEILLEG